MFILTARMTKKRAILLAAAIAAAAGLLLLAVCFLRGGKAEERTVLATNHDRIAYLQSWGWEVEQEPVETFQLLLPKKLDPGNEEYAKMQRAQGFDLNRYCGRQATRYTYAVTNYPDRPDGVQANLYICGETPIAGDVVASGKDGFQEGLTYPASDR